ncbi:chromosome segregation protein SMC [Cytophaga hutchinsonii]|jgi:chromosome segregation protein|uniref:Chromosome partition protein Smc n=2 Tax=Cytophaga hutchinsonii TaxID=985 RepID=A0A6N4SRE5_CYTH3|nr:chromosome segregation protein SMC [Cytophaga hutchinsonii]ABG58862.1 chromosome segregation protein, Smc family protein [Cytophaga hutchinsonii ATCC 33406]CAD66595.1 SMC protein [Cytophaga hutchinsonii]SFX80853.1 condensin subunit Smc [Cytophaga hutchinsonii ATCC 33406]
MQLSKLEIKGFKSFGDKVVINFDEGITGIVGPNGCGKSNVVDAIRWVLGEQKTRALRSDKMENVIFNGTKNRKPQQMAEVSLSFNNTKNLLPTEYSQVTITRRYYRTGDSEYLLNGVTCRLKDINDLFLDTGIGSDSYAIIELKMVDDILNDKDGSRRELFEEAAGISKFKMRKKQTLKKLEETDKDLERVEDLLFEINKNLKSLEKQAKQTEKYHEIKEDYKNASIDLAKVSVHSQHEEIQALNKTLDEKTDLRTQYNSQINEKESDVERVKLEMVNKEKLLADRQKTLNEHVNLIRTFESDKKIKNERLRFLNDKSKSLTDQIELDKQSNDRAAFSLDSLTKEKESAEKIFEEISLKVEKLKQEYEEQKEKNKLLQEEVGTASSAFKLKQEQVYQINKQLEIYAIQLSSLKQELEKTTSDTSAHSANLSEFESKANEVKRTLDTKNAELETLQAEDERIQQQVINLEKEIEQIREQLTQANRKLDSKQNEFNLTKSMVENLEGFPEAIKFLKKNASWGKDTPLLSDILTCDEKFRLCIENYLESFMNYYVVENEAQAIQAVNLLSDSAKGKANFFVLTRFNNYTSSQKNTFGDCVSALDIVEYDNKYKGLIQYILDGVYIITGNQDIIPEDPQSVFITQNGKLAKRKYSISGGSVGLFEGKRIGRAKNMEKLEADIKQITSDIENIRVVLDTKLKEFYLLKENTKKLEVEELRREINLVNNEYITLKTKQEQLASMLSDNSLRREDVLEKIAKIEEDININTPLAKEGKDELESLEERLNQLNDDFSLQTTQLSNKSAVYNQENIGFHQQQNRVNSLEQEIGYKQTTFDQSKERIAKNLEELEIANGEIRQMVDSADVSEDELISFYKEKESIEQGVHEAEKDYYSTRVRIDEVEKEVKEIRRNREECDEILVTLQNRVTETKIGLSSIKERLNVEFNLNLDDILANQNPDDVLPSEEELKEKVIKIKNSLDRLGPINPMAMEAYQEIKERHVFITTQKEDLAKSKESLMETINEIDTVAKATFLDAFEKIRDNFIRVFRSLFTDEDSCDLKLVDPENPLDSAIDIMAKPKGKRPLTINQLSGGEKTLTAISLLFAIYLIKPAPFCIFDEVDAPLDDANIDKFNNIIRQFAGESQFIIVTHNKRTMASTDIIYGITMVEQGVSRLVPVDLRSLNEA